MPAQDQKTKMWNTLEVTKILVSLLTPLAIVYFSINTNKELNESNKINDHNTRVYNKRQLIYDEIGVDLNDIYAYHMYVGQWKELSPADLIKTKRKLDRKMYTSWPYFSQTSPLRDTYHAFMDAAFETHSGMGEDAKIRTQLTLHKNYRNKVLIKWIDEWDFYFTEEDNRADIHRLYYQFLTHVSKEANLSLIERDSIPKMPDFKPL